MVGERGTYIIAEWDPSYNAWDVTLGVKGEPRRKWIVEGFRVDTFGEAFRMSATVQPMPAGIIFAAKTGYIFEVVDELGHYRPPPEAPYEYVIFECKPEVEHE